MDSLELGFKHSFDINSLEKLENDNSEKPLE